jgi:hypothetical protein
MKKHFAVTLSLSALTFSLYFSACTSKKEATTSSAPSSTAPPTYTADIKQILDANCARTCHSTENHKHGVDLSTYESVKTAAADPGFLGSIGHQTGFPAMPPGGKLDDAVIAKISFWIQNGMPK